MTGVSNRLTIGPTAVVAVGGLLLLSILAPSPARLALWDTVRLTSWDPQFPARLRIMSQTEFDAITERPLFNPDRKKDPPALPQSAVSGLDAYRLAGVMAMGASAIAIVERRQTKETVTLKIGDTFDGRTVSAISADGVVFSGPAGPEVLSIPSVKGVSITARSDGRKSRRESSAAGNGGKKTDDD